MKFWNQNLKNLSPYVPGEQPKNITQIIKLNSNENPYPPSEKIFTCTNELTRTSLSTYPDSSCSQLKNDLSERYQVPVSQIFCGNGSDEILSLIFRSFLAPEDLILIPYPNYTLYETLAQSYGIPYRSVQSDNQFMISFKKLAEGNSKAIFFSNPNAPTGRFYAIEQIAEFCHSYSGLFILDEAYIDFGGESGIKLLSELDNLIVIRTFSKSFSLAGLRLGYAFSSPSIIEGLKRMKDSYNLSYLTQLLGSIAIQEYDYMTQNAKIIIQDRTYLTQKMEVLGFTVINSYANFIFVTHPKYSAKKLFSSLKEEGIFIRYFDQPRLTDYLRITIGKRADLDILLSSIQKIMRSYQ